MFLDYLHEPLINLLNHLLLPEIKSICDSFRIKLKSVNKQTLIDALLKHCNRQTTLTFLKSSDQILKDRIADKMGKCVKLSQNLYDTFHKIHLLYSFTEPAYSKVSDLHLFMGKIIYGDVVLPQYQIDDLAVFDDEQEFGEYSKATEYYNEFLLAFENKKMESVIEIARNVYREFKEILARG